jgi:hypothetical protein
MFVVCTSLGICASAASNFCNLIRPIIFPIPLLTFLACPIILYGNGRIFLLSGCCYLALSVYWHHNKMPPFGLLETGRRRRNFRMGGNSGCPSLTAKGRRNRLSAINKLPVVSEIWRHSLLGRRNRGI